MGSSYSTQCQSWVDDLGFYKKAGCATMMNKPVSGTPSHPHQLWLPDPTFPWVPVPTSFDDGLCIIWMNPFYAKSFWPWYFITAAVTLRQATSSEFQKLENNDIKANSYILFINEMYLDSSTSVITLLSVYKACYRDMSGKIWPVMWRFTSSWCMWFAFH